MADVPKLPGVPLLPSYAPSIVTLTTVDLLSSAFGNIQPIWGIFKNNVPIVLADNVVSFDYRNDWQVADFPLEGGAFASYDKVQNPFEVRIRFSAGGGVDKRRAFLESIDALIQSLDLVDVVTPEEVYTSVNITHQDFRRTAEHGVGLIVVDVWCRQIRVTATQQFTSTKSPDGTAQTNNGTVQPAQASFAETAAAAQVQ